MGWQDDPIMQSAQTKPWESDAIVNPKKDEPKKQTTTPEFLVNQFKKGLASTPALVGLAADLVNHVVTDPVAHILGYKGFAENAAQLAQNKTEEALNVDKGMKEPTNKYGDTSILTHIGGSIAEMAGSMAVPEVGILGSAAKTAIAAKDATKFIKPLAKEALGIVLSGEGGVMGENVSRMDVFHPEGSNVHDKEQEGYFLGSLTGPLAVMKAIDFVGKGGNWIEKSAEDTGIALGGKARQEAAAKKIVGSKLGSQLSSPVTQKNLAESEKISKEIPGFGENITLGRASNVPEIKLKEKQMSDTQADIHRLALEREAGLDKSIHDYAAEKFEAGEAKPNSSAAKIYAELSEKLVNKIKNLNIQSRQLSSQFATRGSEDIGKDARDLLVKQFDLARDAKNAKYDAVRSEADKNGIKVQVSDVLGMAKSIKINDWSTFQDDTGIIDKILNNFGEAKPAKTVVKDLPRGKMTLRGTPPAAEAKSVPFGQFSSLLREANAEAKTLRIAQSLGDVKAGTKLVQVEKVRDVLASKMAEMALPQYGSVGKLLKDANSFYANVYAKTFKQGAGAELLKKGRFGEYAVDNSKIMSSTLFKPNNPSAVKEFLEATGGTPEARKVLENGAYDILSMKVKNGVLSKNGVPI